MGDCADLYLEVGFCLCLAWDDPLFAYVKGIDDLVIGRSS